MNTAVLVSEFQPMLTGLVVAALAAASVVAPPGLAVPSTARLSLQAEGRGVQIYVCAARPGEPGAYDWSFKAPLASLYDPGGHVIGKHYAGPSWEGVDGGKVVGEPMAKSASPDGSAIDWLLLSAKSANGVGVLGKTAYVQRLRTVGGRAPDRACSTANAGAEAQVPYTAEYDFYTAP
jgi:hypothetical protein